MAADVVRIRSRRLSRQSAPAAGRATTDETRSNAPSRSDEASDASLVASTAESDAVRAPCGLGGFPPHRRLKRALWIPRAGCYCPSGEQFVHYGDQEDRSEQHELANLWGDAKQLHSEVRGSSDPGEQRQLGENKEPERQPSGTSEVQRRPDQRDDKDDTPADVRSGKRRSGDDKRQCLRWNVLDQLGRERVRPLFGLAGLWR